MGSKRTTFRDLKTAIMCSLATCAGRCAGHEAGETLAQKEAGPVCTSLYGRHRDVQTVCDFGHRQGLDVAQDDYGTVVVRKLFERRSQNVSKLALHDRAVELC